MVNQIEAPVMETDQLRGAALVGAGLREVRERLGWKLPQVAEALRIRLPYLEAIEQGDLAALPGPAYQTGFVRSYAQVLGLDAEEILRRFRAEGSMVTAPRAELSFLAPVPDRAVPTGAIVLLGVVVVLAAYGLWYRHTETERRLAAEIPSVPAELAPLAVPPKLAVVPPPAPAPKAAVADVSMPASSGGAVPASAAPANALGAAQAPATRPSAPPAPGTAPSSSPVAVTAPAAPAPAAPLPAAPPPGAGESILAVQNSWIEVRDPAGNILFSKVLNAGENWPVPQEAGLVMTAGNAGGTEIFVNGKPSAPLGAAGTVLHGYALTPAANSAQPPAPAAGAK